MTRSGSLQVDQVDQLGSPFDPGFPHRHRIVPIDRDFGKGSSEQAHHLAIEDVDGGNHQHDLTGPFPWFSVLAH